MLDHPGIPTPARTNGWPPLIVGCPEPGCEGIAQVLDRFTLGSTHGAVEHVRTRCDGGHVRTPRLVRLAR